MSSNSTNKLVVMPTINKIPAHIAIIMDGNGRWAKQRFLPRMIGHREGYKAVQKTVRACGELGVKTLTLFAFSSENWRRPMPEVKGILKLFLFALKEEVKELHANNVKLKVIGDVQGFSAELQNAIYHAEELTANNTGLQLVIAANYGGQWDITQGARKLAAQVAAGELSLDAITPELFGTCLSTAEFTEPDLFIRTSGESRISNFLLWQLAYTELYFTNVLWPDFNEQHLADALAHYAGRERRFGYTGEQVEQLQNA